jgi:hypothetical protein
MMPILTSWARMALLAVPFADPFLIGLVETPEAQALHARDNGYAGVTPETTAATASLPYPGYSCRPS